jgi:anti-sigma factor RsiW
MSAPWSPEALDLLLSCYLDGEMDLADRLELEAWLGSHGAGRGRLDQLRELTTSLGLLGQCPEVPPGWTVRAYRIGLPGSQTPLQRMMYLHLGRAMARPRALGHGRRRWKALLRRTVRVRWNG